MMKYLAIVLLLVTGFAMTSCIGAGDITSVSPQGEDKFPMMTGIDLHGEERTIPDTFDAPYSLVVVAFEREQQTQVDSWINALPDLREAMPSLGFYELPIIYEVGAAKRFWINNGMRAGIEADAARTRTITVYTDRDKFTRMMDMHTKHIYALLLNRNGEIMWRTTGIASDDAITRLKTQLQTIKSDKGATS